QQSNLTVASVLLVLGISFSMAVNYVIMRAAFRPLDAIQHTVEQVSRGNTRARVDPLEVGDPEIVRLGGTINMMLNRLVPDKRLEASKQLTAQTLDAIHNLAWDLRPTMLDDLGLEPSVRWYAKRQSDTYGFNISVDVDGLEERLPSQTEVALFRIVQEALTNV